MMLFKAYFREISRKERTCYMNLPYQFLGVGPRDRRLTGGIPDLQEHCEGVYPFLVQSKERRGLLGCLLLSEDVFFSFYLFSFGCGSWKVGRIGFNGMNFGKSR